MFSLSKRIGIDLGTANSLVWLAGRGIVANEPTVVAVKIDDGQVIEVGNAAKEMLGKTPGNIRASRPMRDGVIADYRVTEAMLRYFIQRVCGRVFLFKPEVMICVPAGVTQVERRGGVGATFASGAETAHVSDEPLGAAVISLGGVVVHKSVRVAGNKLDEAIINYMKRRHNLIIGETTAEEVKKRIGSATVLLVEETMEVKWRGSVA